MRLVVGPKLTKIYLNRGIKRYEQALKTLEEKEKPVRSGIDILDRGEKLLQIGFKLLNKDIAASQKLNFFSYMKYKKSSQYIEQVSERIETLSSKIEESIEKNKAEYLQHLN